MGKKGGKFIHIHIFFLFWQVFIASNFMISDKNIGAEVLFIQLDILKGKLSLEFNFRNID